MVISIDTQLTLENLERYQQQQRGISYWKTINFFPYDEQYEQQLKELLAIDKGSIEEQIRDVATEISVSLEDFKQQFENYLKVTKTPFCVWQEDRLSGELNPIFFASLDNLVEHFQPLAVENDSMPKTPGVLGKILSISKRIAPWIWATVVVIVVIPMVGQWFMVRSLSNDAPQPAIVQTNATPTSAIQAPATQSSQLVQDWVQFEQLAKDKMRSAHAKTEVFARQELDQWSDGLTQRLDESFLGWYFGYFHQKQLQYESFFTGITGKFQQWLDPSKPSPQEKIAEEITREFQEEFAKRVLVPQVSEFQLQNITLKTAKTYIRELGQEFNQIPVESGISATDWNRYLQNISIAIPGMEGKFVALPLKQITTIGAYTALKPLVVPLLPKVGTAVAGKMVTKVGAKLAAKTGGTLAAKLGGTFLDATVGVGIILWDVWDTNHTANIEKPILRRNLIDYIAEIKESVLENPTNGIMTITDKIDAEILKSIQIVKDTQASLDGVS